MGVSCQYRPIKPAPLRGARSGSSSTNCLSGRGLTKRIKAVTQACRTCRRNKAKCDGVRPICGACVARATPCGYDGEAGQSRQAALRSRLEALETLVSALQSQPDDEATRLLRRLRSTDDAASLSSADTGGRRMSDTTTIAPSPGASPPAAPEPADAALPVDAPPSPPTAVKPPLEIQLQQRAADVAQPPHEGLPSAKTTWAGVQSFFVSCGGLFHIYSQQQMETYYRVAFDADGRADTSQKLAICCLSAVAAVGIQYYPGSFEEGLEKVFHEVSRRFFSEVMEEHPLDTIKVCTLFAMYNILDKATAALAYVEVGLSMSKRQSQSTGVCHPSMLSTEQWIDFRRTWRALLFFSSWLSSTLGYISSANDSDFTKLLPVAEQDHDSYSAELGELVQAEMTKISLLKAAILRNHLAVHEFTTLGLDGIIRELQDWHVQLPESMKLRSLCRTDWPPLVRWSIYYLHLLYHGAFMLVYRRVAAHCIRLQRTGGDLAATSREPNLLSLVEQGITSARDTARIVNLLLSEQGIFKRCWIVIFQTHTACVVLLHSVAQKQLHRFPPSSWAEDLKRAQQFLNVLAYCGKVDPVALRFRVRLSGIVGSLSNPSAQDRTATPETFHNPPAHYPIEYLFTTPPSPDPRLLTLSFSLLLALCRPWSDGDTHPTATPCTGALPSEGTATATVPSTAASAADAAPAVTDANADTDADTDAGTDTCTQTNTEDGVLDSQKQPRFWEGLEWDLEKVTPFRWDTDGMGMLKEGEVVEESRFLDSESPSGWAAAEDLEVEGKGEVT